MKWFLTFLVLAMPLWLVAQPLEPYRHNFFTTNPAPVVQAVAGSNVFITYSTPGTATRTFLIDVPASGAATNVFRSEAGTNVVIVTNGFLYTISVPSFVNGTNGLNGTNGVNGINGTNGVNGINGTNGVNGVNGTNAAIFITNTITGSPGSSASVTNLGDSLNALFQFTIPAGINGTNGLNGANGTNGVDGINGTNGAPGINGTNAAVGLVTNEFTITPGLTTNGLQYLPLAGGTVNGPVLTTSGTTNGPSQNELATAGWVRGLFNVGANYYVTTVIDAVATNSNPGLGQPVYDFASTIPASTSRSYTTSDFLTNNGYLGSVVTTNSFMALGGTIAVNGYLGFTGGSSTPTLTIHPEIYYSYDRTNWFGDFSGGTQAIVHGTTNIYEWAINFPTLTATNSTGFYVQRRFKCDSVTGAGVRTFTILIGTNVLSGVNDATHVTMQSPSATSGDAFLAANQTFTGSNTFSGGMMVWGDGNKTNGVWIGPSGEVLSNAVGSVTIAGGNVTASGKLSGDGSGISNVVSCIQVFQGHDTPAFTSVLPKYAPPMGTSTGYDGAEVNLCVPFARAGILTNLFVRTLALGAGTNLVVTIWTNGAASNLTLNYNGIGSLQQASNLTSGVYVPAGCTLSVEMKGNNATANNARILWSFEKLSQ